MEVGLEPSVTGIESWLAELGLEKYARVFAEHEITLDVLPDLTEADLDRMELPTGPRRRVLVAISERSHTGESPPAAVPVAEAERRQLTVMFCDLVGYTALSGRLDPEELRELIHAYRRAAADVVSAYDGHVAQYLGDGVMAYFGWPRAHENDVERCVRAALEIVQAVKSVSSPEPLSTRVGVATGTVVVGEASRAIDAEARLAVGETPNLASRLHGVASPDQVVISPTTRRLVGDAFELTDMGMHELAGIVEPVHVWGVDAVRRGKGRFEAAHEGLPLTPFVGRDEEMGRLRRAWARAAQGEGCAVLIGGEAGIGKSRLTQVIRDEVAGGHHTVLSYQCSPYHVNSAMYPFIQHLEVAAGFAHDDPPARKLDRLEAVLAGDEARIAEAAQLIAAMLTLPTDRYGPLEPSPQVRKEKTLEALVGQIEALAERKPVLILFEDAHWVDPTSQEALDLLLPRLAGRPVLAVITYRPEYTVRWEELLHVENIEVTRLGRSHGAELVDRVTRGRQLPVEVLDRIVTQTDGVPLFVEELTKSVLESGLLREQNGHYELAGPLPSLAIPTSLRDSLLARLDRLAHVKDIIQIGACVGRDFSYELLSHVAAGRESPLDEGLRTLTESGLVHRRGAGPDAIFTFKHALVQDAAYDSLLRRDRQRLHARIASTLEEQFSSRIAIEPELLAHHYTEAGKLADAVPWWRAAGKLAALRVALREAAVHFQRGTTLTEKLAPSPDRDELELSIREPLNAVLTAIRGWAAPEVSENALRILELTKRQGKSQAVRTGLWAIWVNTTTTGRIAESLKWADRMIAEGEEAEDVDLKIFGHGAAMISHFYLGNLLEARDHGDSVLALYDPLHAERWMEVTAHDLRTLVGVWSGQWTWMLGYPDRAVRMNAEKDAYARELGDPFNLGFALTLGAYEFDYRSEPEPLLERVREIQLVDKENAVPLMDQVMVPQVIGLALLRAGDYPGSIEAMTEGLEHWYARGGRSRVPYLKSALAEAIARNGDVEQGLRLVDECLDQIARPGWEERSHLAEVLRLKAWMLMELERDQEAEPPLREAIAWAGEQQAKSWELRAATTLAQLLSARGERESAREVLAPVYDWFTEGFDTHDLTVAKELLESLG